MKKFIISLVLLVIFCFSACYFIFFSNEWKLNQHPCSPLSENLILFKLHEISDPEYKVVDPFIVKGTAWIDGKKTFQEYTVANIIFPPDYRSIHKYLQNNLEPLVCLHKSNINGQLTLEMAKHQNFDAAIKYLNKQKNN